MADWYLARIGFFVVSNDNEYAVLGGTHHEKILDSLIERHLYALLNAGVYQLWA